MKARPGPEEVDENKSRARSVELCNDLWWISKHYQALTGLHHSVYTNAQLMSHESKNRENDKSSNETGAAVQQGDPEDVPEGQTQRKHSRQDRKRQIWVQNEWVVKKIIGILMPVISCFVLPIAIVVIVIVAAQDNQSSSSQAICKHYLGCCIFPDLESKEIFTSEQF